MTSWAGRRVLVTGASGFLGGVLTERLRAAGATVTGVSRATGGDVRDAAAMARAVDGIDTVFHLAGQAGVGAARRAPGETFETNVGGAWTVLEAARRAGVSRVVFASSERVYAGEAPYDETSPLAAGEPYDVSKVCSDLIALSYAESQGLPVSVGRLANLYGPGDRNLTRIVPATITAMLAGRAPTLRSDGAPVRDYLYAADAAAGLMRLAERIDLAACKAFNFASGEPVSVIELMRRILRLGGRPDLEPHAAPSPEVEDQRRFASARLAETTLDWRPAQSLDEGLALTIAGYKTAAARPLQEASCLAS